MTQHTRHCVAGIDCSDLLSNLRIDTYSEFIKWYNPYFVSIYLIVKARTTNEVTVTGNRNPSNIFY